MFDFAAAFDKPTALRLETIAQQSAQQNGIDRRLAFAILTKSAAEARILAALVIDIRCARVKPKDKRTTPTHSRQAWMQFSWTGAGRPCWKPALRALPGRAL
jgi:hypothetical protein